MKENSMNIKTADLYDEFEERLQVCEPIFQHYGGHHSFCGPIETLKCHEDNSLIGELLRQPGEGRVLVVDAGGSLRCAMLGDRLAQHAVDNQWAGVLMFGCVRDSVDLVEMPLGVVALATNPRKSIKKGIGETGISIKFGGVVFKSREWLYADEDGVIVSATKLL